MAPLWTVHTLNHCDCMTTRWLLWVTVSSRRRLGQLDRFLKGQEQLAATSAGSQSSSAPGCSWRPDGSCRMHDPSTCCLVAQVLAEGVLHGRCANLEHFCSCTPFLYL